MLGKRNFQIFMPIDRRIAVQVKFINILQKFFRKLGVKAPSYKK